jgi:cyclopropane fatty-acyl-phospholipid synthase-like methyltransferase
MNPFRYRAIAEADHGIQNPLSPEKLKRVVDYLRPRDDERLIDVGCGKGSFLLAMTGEHRVDAIGLELNPAFAAEARAALERQAPAGSARIVLGPALEFEAAPGGCDMAVCIGATFALGGLEPSLDWLTAAVRSGGRIAVGEPFARRPSSPEASERQREYDRTLADIAAAVNARGLVLTGLVASADEDWDHYESQHWRAATAWLRANPTDPDAAWLAERIEAGRSAYLAEERDAFGWAVFIALKT